MTKRRSPTSTGKPKRTTSRAVDAAVAASAQRNGAGAKKTGGGPAASKQAKAGSPQAKHRSSRGLSPGGTRVIAIANQKGGVGKSTTAVSLGAALAELSYRVLVVDLDPQGNASTGLGIRHESREVTVYEVLAGEAPIDVAIVATPVENLDAVPSTIDLAGAEIELVSQFSRELRLRKALEPLQGAGYHFVLLDCPPSLGLLTVNALAAAEELIVPIQCEYYALEGLGQLLRNVRLVQQNVNAGLKLTGIVMTMFDPRTKLSEQVVEEVRRYFGDRVYGTVIPRTVRLSEAPGFGQPITVYDPRSRGAECYRDLAEEVAGRPVPEDPLPLFEELPTVGVPPAASVVMTAPRPLTRVPEEREVEEPLEVTGTVYAEGFPAQGPSRAGEGVESAESVLPEGEVQPLPPAPALEEAPEDGPEPAGEYAPAGADWLRSLEAEAEAEAETVVGPVGATPGRTGVLSPEPESAPTVEPEPGRAPDPTDAVGVTAARTGAQLEPGTARQAGREAAGLQKKWWRLFRRGGDR